MMEIANEYIRVQVSAQGAELQSIVRKDNQLEYLWSGDPAFWGKKSPVLFPIVGGLKNNAYQYKGKTYQLGRHGFARDMAFNVNEHTPTSITFSLSDNEQTLDKYPFPFTLTVRYAIQNATLKVGYSVQNTGDEPMYFSIGAHPAFKVPLTEGTSFDDYSLHFSEAEQAPVWPLSDEGLIQTTPVPYLEDTTALPLEKPMFYKDALVFKHLASETISIRSDKTPHGLEVSFPGFPYMGIWSAKNADFVCIEPWCGIADHVNASGELNEKEGIHQLAPEGIFKREWSAIFF
ncbi:aldose 1-epimerase family protein [Chitinophaga sp. GCM10012297]|uniref:Aldose 1-epimerase family protein n=1 Tax=Chitinophaga chungangae TaxID=2821488 RepID=A0ABS3YGE4_9BACT|nr:aldose 1-epimerase family protein [Chitinophaga chungangae]MBO9153741.1 aldose 1-epimerase family protein [Chitinophaga chungangae]